MPESGGPTAQSGILYQNSVAALYLGRLCDTRERPNHETVQRVRIEAPEHVDDIVVSFADEHTAFVQAKENLNSYEDAWAKLWRAFSDQFLDPNFKRQKDRLVLHVGTFREEHNTLRELCQRARNSDSYDELLRRVSNTQRSLVENVKRYLPVQLIELVGEEDLLGLLAAVDVEVWTLPHIERDLLLYWMPETTGSPSLVFRALRDRAAEAGRVRGSFEANTLRNDLANDYPGFHFVTPRDIQELRRSIRDASSLLRQQRHSIGNAKLHITRSTVGDIVSWASHACNESDNVALLLDTAGMGKTVVLRDVLCKLEASSVDVLAVKADQQLSGVASLPDVRARLELAVDVVDAVERLAKLGRVVVLIDQVDALSLSMAHDQPALYVVLDLIARLRRLVNVRVVLSCRMFDFNSDPRLNKVEHTHRYSLASLSDQEIESALSPLGVEFHSLSGPTQILLRTPLHLDLFVRAIESSNQLIAQQGVSSLQELYNYIWQVVVNRYDPHAPSSTERVELLYLVTEEMHRRQETKVTHSLLHESTVSHLLPAAQWLSSEGILINDGTGWTFLHQTFFDYCYARRFFERGGDILAEILNSDQGLFVRPQLLQVISYLRSTDHRRYIAVLTQLLGEARLRFHLRDLLLGWFGGLTAPTDEEWLVARRILADPSKRGLLLNKMCANLGWFDRINSVYLQVWLDDEQVIDDLLVPYLVSFVDTAQSQVMNIVSPVYRRSEQWRRRTGFILFSVRDWSTREAIELFEEYICDLPTLDRVQYYELVAVTRAHPPTGCKIARHLLDRALAHYSAKKDSELRELGETHAYSYVRVNLYAVLDALDNTRLGEVVAVASQAEPKLFLELMIPWLSTALKLCRPPTEASPQYYLYDDLALGFHGDSDEVIIQLFRGCITALVATATDDPMCFAAHVAQLASLPYSTAQTLLVCTYGSVPESHAHQACEFLLSDLRRLHLSGIGQCSSKQMIKAIYPFLSDIDRALLEKQILAYAPIHKKSGIEGLNWRGIEQLDLLQAIPEQYLSSLAIRRLRELERKFPQVRLSEEQAKITFGAVASPIPEDKARRMSDRDWLRAMRKYKNGVQHPGRFMGGAEQLATVLFNQVKENPTRFNSLLKRAPDNIDDRYVTAFINGFAQSDCPADWLYAAIRRFAELREGTLARSIAGALRTKVGEGIPNDLILLLYHYLSDSPGDDELWWMQGSNNGDPFMSYVNSDRGSVYDLLMRILDHQNTPESTLEKWSLLERACFDASTALRAGAIQELTYMISDDRERALSYYQLLIDGHEVLLASAQSREFLYWALRRNFHAVKPFIMAMMAYPDETTQRNGAELACIAALSRPVLESEDASREAQDLADAAISGPATWRRGAARIYASNLTRNAVSECLPKVLALLMDDDDHVKQLVASIFSGMNAGHFYTLRSFIESYVHSVDFPEHSCVNYLWEYGLWDPQWTLTLVRHIAAETIARQGADLSLMTTLVRIVLQIYKDPASDAEMRREATNVFDVFMERYSLSAQSVLTEWDSR